MEAIVGLILWVLANWVYVDMRRRGERGIKRFFAFWLGWPGTFVGMLSVDEKSQPTIRADDRDLRSLVQEIRRDRMLRGPGESGPPGAGEPTSGPESAPGEAPAGESEEPEGEEP
ncbi:MAG: hypothetical protein PVI57_09205 [Gemmatimonadota bacterium]|jgi:hypothetical protein